MIVQAIVQAVVPCVPSSPSVPSAVSLCAARSRVRVRVRAAAPDTTGRVRPGPLVPYHKVHESAGAGAAPTPGRGGLSGAGVGQPPAHRKKAENRRKCLDERQEAPCAGAARARPGAAGGLRAPER